MSTVHDMICFQVPAWLSLGQPSVEAVRGVVEAVDPAKEQSSGSLVTMLSAFVIGWQVSSYGLAEGFTRLSDTMKAKGKWKDLVALFWVLGIFFGKLGFGRPSLEKKREREAIERRVIKKSKMRANIDREIDQTDLGRYVRYKHDTARGIGLMTNFDNARHLVIVQNIMTQERLTVDMRTVTFMSDEEKLP